MRKRMMKHFSFDKLSYSYEMPEEEMVFPQEPEMLFESDLKVAG